MSRTYIKTKQTKTVGQDGLGLWPQLWGGRDGHVPGASCPASLVYWWVRPRCEDSVYKQGCLLTSTQTPLPLHTHSRAWRLSRNATQRDHVTLKLLLSVLIPQTRNSNPVSLWSARAPQKPSNVQNGGELGTQLVEVYSCLLGKCDLLTQKTSLCNGDS